MATQPYRSRTNLKSSPDHSNKTFEVRDKSGGVISMRHLYPVAGGAAATYYVIESDIYDMSSGKALFYIRDNKVYSHANGQAAYKIDDGFLYDYETDIPIFYFSE